MGVSSSESHDLTAFYEMLTASFGVLSQNTGFYPSLDRIVETMLRPLNLGPGGGSYNKPISRLHCLTKKLDHKWLGPFVIEKVVSPAAIKLCLSTCEQGIHLVISVSNVHPYHPDPILECLLNPCPNPVLIDGGEEYEVESIVDSQYRYQHLHYLEKFK